MLALHGVFLIRAATREQQIPRCGASKWQVGEPLPFAGAVGDWDAERERRHPRAGRSLLERKASTEYGFVVLYRYKE